MICETCGGSVTWRGPFSNLTHTECESCGRHNNQIVDQPGDEESDEGSTMTNTTTASQPNAAPSERNAVQGSESARAIRRAVKYLKENGCTGPAADLEALLAAPALPEPPTDGEIYAAVSKQHAPADMQAFGQASIDALAPEPAAALDNTAIRKILHKYSRHMDQSGYYSDTEFACLQDVIAFAKEIAALASASPQPLAEVSAAQAVPELTEAEILESLNTLSHEPPKRLPPGWINFARSIERKVQAKFAQSTDTTREA